MAMDIYGLTAGDQVTLYDGTAATVQAPTQDGEWVLVRYADGSEDLCLVDEIETR